MATLTIRNLPEATRRALKERAAQQPVDGGGGSRDPGVGCRRGALGASLALRGDFEPPARSRGREIALS